jgi:HD superfamily phosphodiesterase
MAKTHNELVLEKIKLRNRANEIIKKFYAGQRQKNGEDFINHSIRVGKIILQCLKNSESLNNCYIAGLLHDIVGNTAYTQEELLSDFGREICKIVMEVREDRSESWKARKEHAIERLDKISLEGLSVVLADKIDHLNSLSEMAEKTNLTIEKLFETKFNNGFENQKWYYSKIYLKSLKAVFNVRNDEKLKGSNFNSIHFANLFYRYQKAVFEVFGLFSQKKYLESIKEINEDNYLPVLFNRKIEKDTHINQIQFDTEIIDGKKYYFVYESWYWDHVWGQSAVFIGKQFEHLSVSEKEKLVLKILSEKTAVKEQGYTFKDDGNFIFCNYNFHTGS